MKQYTIQEIWELHQLFLQGHKDGVNSLYFGYEFTVRDNDSDKK